MIVLLGSDNPGIRFACRKTVTSHGAAKEKLSSGSRGCRKAKSRYRTVIVSKGCKEPAPANREPVIYSPEIRQR